MNYVDNVYGNLLGNIRNEVGVDETTAARKRYVANVVIGDFSTEKVYLLNTEFLDQTNHFQTWRLVSSMKKVFKKSPKRIQAFKNANPECPLQPETVLTR